MVSTVYNGSASVATAYAAADVYTLNISPATVTNFSQIGGNVVIQTGSTSLTITGVTLAALATTNFVLQGGGSVVLGDALVATAVDDSGNAIAGSIAGDILLGLGGSDTIVGSTGNNLIFGGAGLIDPTDAGDAITSASGNDTIYGNGGNDTIEGGSGLDSVTGGNGADLISLTPALGQSAIAFGGGGVIDTTDVGNDTINVGASGASVAGGATIYGNAGDDQLNVFSSGSNSVYGGIGNDTIVVNGGGANLIVGGTNDGDSITISGDGANTVYGGSGISDGADLSDNFTVNGGGANLIYGNGGNDVVSITGGGGNTVYGGLGNEAITIVGGGNNLVFGGTGDTDTINVTGNGNNTLYGGSSINDTTDLADNITLSGTGNNLIYGNAGNDIVTLGAAAQNLGANTVYGGLGDDDILVAGGQAGGPNGTAPAASSLLVQGGTGSDIINLLSYAGGTSTVFGGNGFTDTADSADTIRAGAAADLIYGNGGDDVITSGAGDDSIYGGAGLDRILINGAGNKFIGGNEIGEKILIQTAAGVAAFTAATVAGGNVVITETGGRTISFDAPNSIVNLGFDTAANLAEPGFVTGTAPSGSGTLVANFGTTARTLTGTAIVDKLYSGDAADTLIGGLGADSIFGGGGADAITLDGADIIQAGDGNDILNVALRTDIGANLITGGAGTDTLNFTTVVNGALGTGLTGFEVIKFVDAVNVLTTADENVATGETLTIDASNLTGTNTLDFSGNSEATGRFSIIGGAGKDSLIGGGGADTIIGGGGNDYSLVSSGGDTINLGDGNDYFNTNFGNLSGATLDGGAGLLDQLNLLGGGTLTLSANVTNIEILSLANNTSITLTTNNANVAAGASLSVFGTGTGTLVFNGTNETDGRFSVNGGSAADTITGGAGNDTISGGAGGAATSGVDVINVGSGDDQVYFGTAFAGNSTANHDAISNFAFGAASGDSYDVGFFVSNGSQGAELNLAPLAPVALATNGTATANDVIFTFIGSGDKLAGGTVAATAVDNARFVLTDGGSDFSSTNITAGDSLILVLDNGTDSFIYHYVAGGVAATTEIGDLELIGIVTGQTANQITIGDFV